MPTRSTPPFLGGASRAPCRPAPPSTTLASGLASGITEAPGRERSHGPPVREGRWGHPTTLQDNTTPCVAISDPARRRLLELAGQLQPWWDSNMAATGEFFGGLAQLAWDDLLGIAKVGQGALDRYGGSPDPGRTLVRDIESGTLGAHSAAGKYLSSPDELAKLDPVRLVRLEVEKYQRLWNQSHAGAASRGAYEVLALAPLPACRPARAVITPVREAQAVRKAEHITENLSGAGRRAAAFSDGWGNQPHTGARGTPPASVRGNPYNPECGQFNCFAVALAKTRAFTTGRPFSASAIRPGMNADVAIQSAEIQNILARTYALGGVRQTSLYSWRELFDHALGMPSRMSMDRIATILHRSGPGAQGLVFVRTPAHQPTFPGETVGHAFNAVNQNGAVRFVDEQPTGGSMDARFWFLEATEIWFYEVR